MKKKIKKNIVNLSKNLFPVKKCPICQNKKFSKQGRVNGVHLDLKNLCNLSFEPPMIMKFFHVVYIEVKKYHQHFVKVV